MLEKRLAALEGGSSVLALASGSAAITYTIEALAANGGHIVAQKTIYGGSYNLLAHTLPQFGIETTFVDAHNLKEVEAAIKDNTRAGCLCNLYQGDSSKRYGSDHISVQCISSATGSSCQCCRC